MKNVRKNYVRFKIHCGNAAAFRYSYAIRPQIISHVVVEELKYLNNSTIELHSVWRARLSPEFVSVLSIQFSMSWQMLQKVQFFGECVKFRSTIDKEFRTLCRNNLLNVLSATPSKFYILNSLIAYCTNRMTEKSFWMPNNSLPTKAKTMQTTPACMLTALTFQPKRNEIRLVDENCCEWIWCQCWCRWRRSVSTG